MRVLLESESFRDVCVQNAQGQTALHCVAEQGSEDIARMLLRSDRFTDGAVNALAGEHVPSTRVEQNIRATKDGLTALHVAARFGQVAVAKALLEEERFRQVNVATSQGRLNALHFAAWHGHVGVAKALLENVRRFDAVNALDWNAGSALSIAAEYGKCGCCEAAP